MTRLQKGLNSNLLPAPIGSFWLTKGQSEAAACGSNTKNKRRLVKLETAFMLTWMLQSLWQHWCQQQHLISCQSLENIATSPTITATKRSTSTRRLNQQWKHFFSGHNYSPLLDGDHAILRWFVGSVSSSARVKGWVSRIVLQNDKGQHDKAADGRCLIRKSADRYSNKNGFQCQLIRIT